jgi:hypothetical protein
MDGGVYYDLCCSRCVWHGYHHYRYLEVSRMTTHHPECEDATGAYAGSCTCAAIKRREALDNLFASDADLIDVEIEASQEGGWKEAGQPWLWTYDAHLKGTNNAE